MPRTKLIRNLQPGDEIELTDLTQDKPVRHRVRVTGVYEARRGIDGHRIWRAYFTPPLNFGSWEYVWGYFDDRIEVIS